jgi:hypothetical protein
MNLINPCSVPPWLRFLVENEPPEIQQACADHDEAYRRGGTELGRALADARFLVKLLEVGIAIDWEHVEYSESYYLAVRQYGASHWGGGAWMWTRNEVPEA